MSQSDTSTDVRERILAEIVRLTGPDGKPPGRRKFFQETGISEYQVSEFWPTWTEAISAAGLAPNVLNQQIPESDMLAMLADLTRHFKSIPSHNQIVWGSKNVSGFPHYKTWSNRFGNKDGIVEALRQWVATKVEFADVAEVLQTHTGGKPRTAPNVIRNDDEIVVLSDSYLPPVVASLQALGRGDASIVDACKRLGRDESSEFERRVGIAFEILGLTVEPMGQGYGRVADGIARCNSSGWAVIYDAKLRRDHYRLLTEDRKFREYIETHVPALRNAGLQRCYFAIVSSQFSPTDVERAHELVRRSDIKSLVFIETSALVSLVESRVRNVTSFNMDDVERHFTRTRILTEQDVRKGR